MRSPPAGHVCFSRKAEATASCLTGLAVDVTGKSPMVGRAEPPTGEPPPTSDSLGDERRDQTQRAGGRGSPVESPRHRPGAVRALRLDRGQAVVAVRISSRAREDGTELWPLGLADREGPDEPVRVGGVLSRHLPPV